MIAQKCFPNRQGNDHVHEFWRKSSLAPILLGSKRFSGLKHDQRPFPNQICQRFCLLLSRSQYFHLMLEMTTYMMWNVSGHIHERKMITNTKYTEHRPAWSVSRNYLKKTLQIDSSSFFDTNKSQPISKSHQNRSIDKTINLSYHYIQSNDSLTALDTNNSWLPPLTHILTV